MLQILNGTRFVGKYIKQPIFISLLGGIFMKKVKRIFFALLSIIVLFPSITSYASVQETNTTLSETLIKDTNHAVITDKKTILALAEEQNLENPEKITKIIMDSYDLDDSEVSVPIASDTEINTLDDSNENLLAGIITHKTYLTNIQDLGDHYSYWDVYLSYWYDGYLENTKTFTMTASAGYSSSIPISIELINSTFGITLGLSASYSDVTTIIVPAGQRVNVKTWVNYHKKTFDVYYEYSGSEGLLYYQGPGSVSEPIGLIITQTFYDL